jgi:hypothetical protein
MKAILDWIPFIVIFTSAILVAFLVFAAIVLGSIMIVHLTANGPLLLWH